MEQFANFLSAFFVSLQLCATGCKNIFRFFGHIREWANKRTEEVDFT